MIVAFKRDPYHDRIFLVIGDGKARPTFFLLATLFFASCNWHNYCIQVREKLSPFWPILKYELSKKLTDGKAPPIQVIFSLTW